LAHTSLGFPSDPTNPMTEICQTKSDVGRFVQGSGLKLM
jgi:hypothetical protein